MQREGKGGHDATSCPHPGKGVIRIFPLRKGIFLIAPFYYTPHLKNAPTVFAGGVKKPIAPAKTILYVVDLKHSQGAAT
jgi:hypothetical protein